MATLTIYLDEEILRKVEAAARKEGSSISGWARGHLAAAAEPRSELPEGWFELMGSLQDPTFVEPEESDVPLREVRFKEA